MTILISNLEDWLEDMSDDEIEQISGGINVSCDVYPQEARNRRNRHVIQDIAIGAGAAASVSDRLPLAATYVRGIAQDPTTRRI